MESPTKVKTFWNEEWVKIKTLAPTKHHTYHFSNLGRLKRVDKRTKDERLLKGSVIAGFPALNIRLKGDRRQNFYVHKLVAEAFVKNDKPKDKKFLIHKDGDKKNNNYKNLKWITRDELTQIQIDKGVYLLENKKKPHFVKLNENKVRLIRKRVAAGKTKPEIIARDFNISITQLKRVVNRENWKNVD